MNPTVKEDILHILGEILGNISRNNIEALHDLSNQTIHNASIFQDEDSVNIAVIAYALHKIILRNHGYVHPKIIKLLEDARDCLAMDNCDKCREKLHELLAFIARMDRKLGLYIKQIINEAQIRKGSKIFDHGISMARSAEILGISQWELMKYLGNTTWIDGEGGVDIKQRLRFTRNLFDGGV